MPHSNWARNEHDSFCCTSFVWVLNHQSKGRDTLKKHMLLVAATPPNLKLLMCSCTKVLCFHVVLCFFFSQTSTSAVLIQLEEKLGWFSGAVHVFLTRSFEICPPLQSQSKSGLPVWVFSLTKNVNFPLLLLCTSAAPWFVCFGHDVPPLCSINVMPQAKDQEKSMDCRGKGYDPGVMGWGGSWSLEAVCSVLVNPPF